MALENPKRQGFVLSHKSGVFSINGNEVRGIKSVSVDPTIDGREEVYDNGVLALGFTKGQAKVGLTVKMDYAHFREWMAENGFSRGFLMRSGFTLSCTYQEGDTTRSTEVDGVNFTGLPTTSEGTSGMEIEVPGMGIDVKMDGESIFDADV